MEVVKVATIARECVGVDTPTRRTSVVGNIRPDRVRVVVRPETFGERLRRLRRERGLTQRGLAGLADLPQQTVNDSESGRPDVMARTVAALARALGVTMDALFLGGGS